MVLRPRAIYKLESDIDLALKGKVLNLSIMKTMSLARFARKNRDTEWGGGLIFEWEIKRTVIFLYWPEAL